MVNVYYSRTDKNKIYGRELSYTMEQGAYNEICEGTFNPQKIIDYINETYGLLGTVTELHLEG